MIEKTADYSSEEKNGDCKLNCVKQTENTSTDIGAY
jgi:hypothetical protein